MNKCDKLKEMQNKIEIINQRDEPIYQTVGRKLAAVRKEKGLNQQEVADIIGVSRGALSYWEKGDRVIDIDTLYKLCTVYDISIDYLVGTKSTPNTELNYSIVNDITSFGFSVEAIESMIGKPDTVQLLNDILLHPDCQNIEELTHYSRYTKYETIDCDYRAFLTSKLLHSMLGDIYKKWYVDNEDRLKELSQDEKEKLLEQIKGYLTRINEYEQNKSNYNYDFLTFDELSDQLRVFYTKIEKYM